MKFLNKKTREEAEKEYEYAACLKDYTKAQDEYVNEIRLWDTTDGAIMGDWLADKPEERGYIIEVIMNGCGQLVKLTDKNLVEACAAFNTILQTMKA